jgi:hypothetical protein
VYIQSAVASATIIRVAIFKGLSFHECFLLGVLIIFELQNLGGEALIGLQQSVLELILVLAEQIQVVGGLEPRGSWQR